VFTSKIFLWTKFQSDNWMGKESMQMVRKIFVRKRVKCKNIIKYTTIERIFTEGKFLRGRVCHGRRQGG